MAAKKPINPAVNYNNVSICTMIINQMTGAVLLAMRDGAQDKPNTYSFTSSGFWNQEEQETLVDVVQQSAQADGLGDIVSPTELIPFPDLIFTEKRDYGIEYGDIACNSRCVIVLVNDEKASDITQRTPTARFTEFVMVAVDELPKYVDSMAHTDQRYYVQRYLDALNKAEESEILFLLKEIQHHFPIC